MLLATLIVLLVVFIMLGMEVAWAIGFACLSYLVLSDVFLDDANYVSFPLYVFDGVDSFALLAIPLFLFAGELMTEAGVTQRLVRVASAFVGHVRGGLANVGVVSNYGMAGISGSAIADAAATGTVLIPQMKERGYPTGFSCAVIAAASTVGPIVPPSISFVLIGAIMNLSVGKLFLAGIVPGTLMSVSMFIVTWWIARRRGYPVEARAGWAERRAAILAALLPLAAPLVVVRSMSAGIATPTEAAAILVTYVVLLGIFVFRTLSLRALLDCAARAALVSSIIMLTVGMAQMFSALSVLERFGELVTAAMLAVSTNVNVLLLVFNVMLLALGTFMEPLPLMLVLGPIVFPLFQEMGVDPIHLAVIFVINVVLGLVTPPVGLILNVVGLIARVDPMAVFKDMMPYLYVLFAVLLLITYVPGLSLWLPNLLMD
ncbi:MAG: TRAP transporter large permease [Alphaproteobacteria bacterium]